MPRKFHTGSEIGVIFGQKAPEKHIFITCDPPASPSMELGRAMEARFLAAFLEAPKRKDITKCKKCHKDVLLELVYKCFYCGPVCFKKSN